MYVYFWLYICFGIFSWIHSTRVLFFPSYIQKHSTTSTLLQKRKLWCVQQYTHNIHTTHFVCVLFCKHIFCVGATANTELKKNCTHTHTHTASTLAHTQTHPHIFKHAYAHSLCCQLSISAWRWQRWKFIYIHVSGCVCERERERGNAYIHLQHNTYTYIHAYFQSCTYIQTNALASMHSYTPHTCMHTHTHLYCQDTVKRHQNSFCMPLSYVWCDASMHSYFYTHHIHISLHTHLCIARGTRTLSACLSHMCDVTPPYIYILIRTTCIYSYVSTFKLRGAREHFGRASFLYVTSIFHIFDVRCDFESDMTHSCAMVWL